MKDNLAFNILRGVAATTAVLIAGVIPVLGAFLILAVLLPIFALTASRGVAAGIGSSVILGMLAALVAGHPAGLGLALFFLGAGVLPALAMKRGWPVRRLIPISVAGSSVSVVISLLVVWLVSGINLYAQAISGLKQFFSGNISAMGPFFNEKSAEALAQSMKQAAPAMKQIVSLLPMLVPGVTVTMLLLMAFVSIGAGILLLRRRGHAVPEIPSIILWRAPWYWSWGFVLGLGLQVAAELLPVPSGLEKTMVGGGQSLLLIFGVVYFVQGLAIAGFFLARWKAPAVLVAIVMGLIVVLPVLSEIMLFMGVLDTWFDFRKLDARPDAGEEAEESAGEDSSGDEDPGVGEKIDEVVADKIELSGTAEELQKDKSSS